MTALLAWAPQPTDKALLQRARDVERRFKLSWWDGMIVAAAQLQDCALLLSEDFQDGSLFGDVRVRSPFTLATSEPIAEYRIAASAAPPHPARGRPRTRRSAEPSP